MGESREGGQPISEKNESFEKRKASHIDLALSQKNQASELSGFSRISLIHEALPELDFNRIDLMDDWFCGHQLHPLFVSAITAGHGKSMGLNCLLAEICESHKWALGVGSQRRQLWDSGAASEWREVRKASPDVVLFGNLGLSQLIRTKTDDVRALVDSLEAQAVVIHTNPLQECVQKEGTPEFAGGISALERLCKELDVPVILKEVGCGFSPETLRRLRGVGLFAVDISGLGGTHWGRVEGARHPDDSPLSRVAQTFRSWGESTVETLRAVQDEEMDYALWASGGVRNGLDAAKLLALGASAVGFAKPALEEALKGADFLDKWMETIELELKVALFCTGSANVKQLRLRRPWKDI